MTDGVHAEVRVTRGTLTVDATIDAEPGKTVVVVGPNGAGKTTILHTLAGLLALDAGCILVDDVVLDDPAQGIFVPPETRPIGVVFQDGLLFDTMTVLANVAFGLRARGVHKREADGRALELLERLELADYARAKPRTLSGGQAQRVAIARALAVAPRVLLLDEPLAALDAETRIDVRRVLRDEVGSYDGVRLLVTHDPLEALTLGDDVVVLERGRVIQRGTPEDLRTRPASAYVAQLLGINLLRGTAETAEQFRVDNGFVLHVAIEDGVRGPSVAVVDPGAVTLFAEAPQSSARNTWRATVADLDREPHRVRVRFEAPVELVAHVTPDSAAHLALAPGVEVWCAIKATAVAVHAL
jgi:molybdate transport system ATP-binding protein